MAAPIQLKANTPGGNSYKKSAAAQKPYRGKAAPKAHAPKLRTDHGTKVGGAGIKPAYAASRSVTRPAVSDVNKAVRDYTSQWMQSHGLLHAQDGGSKPRLGYTNVPADGVGAGGSATSRTKSPGPAKRTTSKSSSATTKARVKVTNTGRNFQSTRRTRIVTAK